MKNPNQRQRLIRNVAALAVAGAVTLSTAQSSLARVPVRDVQELLQEGDSDEDREGRGRLLALLARDERPAVRLAVAAALARHPGVLQDAEPLLMKLARDRSLEVQRAASQAFSHQLHDLTAAERAGRLATWASAQHASIRAAAARAVGQGVLVPAADLLLLSLATDESAEVRREALAAASARYFADEELSAQLVRQASSDPDRQVRHAGLKLARITRSARGAA